MAELFSFYRVHERVSLAFDPDSSKTKQQFGPECDVNNILKRFEKTGVIDHVAETAPIYADAPNFDDLQMVLNHVEELRDVFLGFPARIRAMFQNDPIEFLEAMQDPERQAELQELGIVEKPPATPAVPPASSAQPEGESTEPHAPPEGVTDQTPT